MIMIFGAIVLIAVNIIVLSVNSKDRTSSTPIGKITISIVSPLQEMVATAIHKLEGVWRHYFYLVTVAQQNDKLVNDLNAAVEKNNSLKEIEFSHSRIRGLLDFKTTLKRQVVAAEVVGKDPSPWFKTVVINIGTQEGIEKGMPVLTPEGIAGLVTDVSKDYSKVLLIIDQNCSVAALGQNTRARGMIKGEPSGKLRFEYVLRRHEIQQGDIVISSGLDGVFPKGIRIGYVHAVRKPNSGIFQEVSVTPYVDFERLEEVLVVLDPLIPKGFPDS